MSDGKRSDDDDLPAARDFSSVKGGGHSKHAARLRKGNNLVHDRSKPWTGPW